MHELEKYYLGDKEWKNFVNVFSENWKKCEFQKELLDGLNGDEDIAKVIYACIPVNTIDWINKSIKMLDGLSVKECLVEKKLNQRLKTMLMRLPGR